MFPHVEEQYFSKHINDKHNEEFKNYYYNNSIVSSY